MTNKTERYYVVSESEFEAVLDAAREFEAASSYERWMGLNDKLFEAEAACRARPVRFIGAADQGNSLMLWGEVKK